MDDSGAQTPAFPYTIGPKFYGKLQDNSIASAGQAGGGMPVGGTDGDLPGGDLPGGDLPECGPEDAPGEGEAPPDYCVPPAGLMP